MNKHYFTGHQTSLKAAGKKGLASVQAFYCVKGVTTNMESTKVNPSLKPAKRGGGGEAADKIRRKRRGGGDYDVSLPIACDLMTEHDHVHMTVQKYYNCYKLSTIVWNQLQITVHTDYMPTITFVYIFI